MMYRQLLSKLGKNVWFPEVPSNWVKYTTKLISESMFLCGDYGYFFPCPHDDEPDDDVKLQSDKLCEHFRTLTPKYSHTIINAATQVVFEKGKPFDVVSWLSMTNVVVSKDKDKDKDKDDKVNLIRNNGDVVPVESLRGKHILVCGLHIPFFWDSDAAPTIRVLPYACSLENCELVIVPKVLLFDDDMNNNDDDDYAEDAFNHFISGLPSSVLIVPFSDTLRREFLCKSLNLVADRPQFLRVGDNQKVLYYSGLRNCPVFSCSMTFFSYKMARSSWWLAHSKLDDILDCKPSDFVYNLDGDKVSISQLNEKLVGLYLCVEGTLIRPLNLLYQECKDRNLEFEIVVVFIPYFYCAPLQLFKDAMVGVLRQKNISTWWLPPLNNLVSYKLWRACYECWNDELIIVGPHNNKFVEPYGNKVIMDYGVNAYPFRGDLLLPRKFEAYRELTLESLLAYDDHDHLLLKTLHKTYLRDPWHVYNFEKIPLTEVVQGKTVVLLYADYLDSLDFGLYFPLLKWYCEFKRRRKTPHDFEVVFCNLDGGKSGNVMSSLAIMMPWMFWTLNPAQSSVLKERLLKSRRSIIAAFGKDGKIISLNADDLLDSYGPDDFSSYGGLLNEVKNEIDPLFH